MPKKPPRASPGRSRYRSDVVFWVFIVLAVVAGAVMYRAATTRGPSDTGYHSSDTPAQATPAPTASAPRTPASPKPGAPAKLAILGDPYSGGPDVGGVGPANWTALLAQSLSAPGKPVESVVATQNSAGYVKPTGATGAALSQQVAQTVTADDRVVLVFPRPSDAAQSRDVIAAAARDTYNAIKATARAAKLIVIGQSWTSTSPPSSVTDLRDTLRTEATAAGATFIDPLAQRWFVTDTTQLVSRDGVTLTDQGHQYLAEQLQPRVAAALG